jgi:glucose-1-phosphate adenylyltransferase
VCEGSIVVGAVLREVLVGYDCVIHAGSVLEESMMVSGCDVGAGARMRRVLLDKNCKIEPGAVIGYDEDSDRRRFPFVTESGIVVLPKGTHVPARGPIQLAYDIDFLLRNDPATQAVMQAFEGKYTVSKGDRHSYVRAGPRYDRFATRPRSDVEVAAEAPQPEPPPPPIPRADPLA